MDLDPDLTPLQRVTQMMVRICCVGEVFSLPMLTGAMRASRHPLTRAILEQIVRDEAMHGKLGWLYLDWAKDALTLAERDRLGKATAETAEHMSEFWERLRADRRRSAEEQQTVAVMG